MFSQDLTDGAGLECDDPTFVSYATTDDIGVIYCNTTNNFVTFEITSSSAINLLDDQVGLTTEQGIFVHERYNRFFVPSSTGVTMYTYDALGIITLAQSAIGNAGFDACHIEPYVSSDIFLVCVEQTAGILTINGFFSESTGFTQILNNALAFTNPTIANIGFDVQDQIFYVSGNSNNQDYIKISGLREDETQPPPPSDGDPNIIGGVNCNLPENENKLICRVTDPIGGAGNFVIGNGTSGLTGIGCSLGLVDCVNDPNPRTNGLGLLIFIASLFVIIASFYLTIGKEAFTIPIYIWIVIILALSAFFTITGLIDPIFLILTAVALVALAASRLKNVILGGSTMGEGSSA